MYVINLVIFNNNIYASGKFYVDFENNSVEKTKQKRFLSVLVVLKTVSSNVKIKIKIVVVLIKIQFPRIWLKGSTM